MSFNNALNSHSGPSLRPRNRRLISGLSDDGNAAAAGTSSTSPFNSRSASPIPNSHPSRSVSSQQIPRTAPSDRVNALAGRGEASKQDPFGILSGLWGNSWSSLQGLASNVLGNEVALANDQTRQRKPLHSRNSSNAPPPKWGVTTAQAQIGGGTQQERENMVRAMKRKDLLNANGHIYQDNVGRFKRRNSDDRISSSAPPGEGEDRDALVYIHHVQPRDTLAGLTIRYNCQLVTLRKANRMWPNDTAQARKTIVIPVDACGVKGKPCSGPDEEEDDLLLAEETDTIKASPDANGWPVGSDHIGRSRTNTDASNPPASITSTKSESEPPWVHDSWVMFPGENRPVEIARLSRRTLGFFPPARRKSVSFSDQNTPSTSLDIQRRALNDSSPGSPQRSYHDDPSVTSSPGSTEHARTRSRKESISQSFVLQGPGGVGTFNKNVRKPGPAQDGLNKFVKQHLPGMALLPGQEHSAALMPSMFDRLNMTNASLNGSTAAVSFKDNGIDFNKVGGAIETWMRRTASQVSAVITEQKTNTRKSASIPGLGNEAGDLIELQDDAFEIDDDEREQLYRGRPSQPFAVSSRSQLPSGMRSRDGRASSKKGSKGD